MNLKRKQRIMIFGVGVFAHSIAKALKDDGAEVFTYLTRDHGHYGPSLVSKVFDQERHPNPCRIIKKEKISFVVPMSIDWALQSWSKEFLDLNIPILSPKGEGYQIERDRNFSQKLCNQYSVPFAKSFVAKNKSEAKRILKSYPRLYVIKNPLCSPNSPVHTIVNETIEETDYWLDQLDYSQGVFLQEHLGRNEVGHIVFISNGKIYSILTNQEYKRAFDGNQGIIADAPLGGLIEIDPNDKYKIARELIHPLLPWFQKVNFQGPLQVTALKHKRKWHVAEFNIRMGVTSGLLFLRLIKNPVQVLSQAVSNQKITPKSKNGLKFGCSITLAGQNYPYDQLPSPKLPVRVEGKVNCDLWWNQVDLDKKKRIITSGARICDVNAGGRTIREAIDKAYQNIKKVKCGGSYYRTDVGQSLWPPIYD